MTAARLEFQLLGPLSVLCDGEPVRLPQGRPLSLLAYLLLHRNRPVSAARLIDELWSGPPPSSAPTMLHGYVSRLRRDLGEGALQTSADGYVLAVADDQLDATRFEAALDAGREALRAGEPATALRRLATALAAWRGPALADVADQQFARVDAERLDELRMAAEEGRVEARLALGEHAELLGDLAALVERHPLREGLRAQLMLALYRSDRQLDALAVYRDTRRRLSDEFGIEPGPRLRELERRILQQDPALAPAVVARPPAQERNAPARRFALPFAVMLVAGAVAVGLVLGRGGGHARGATGTPPHVGAGSVAVVGPGGVAAWVRLGDDPAFLAAGRAGGVTGVFAVGLAERAVVPVSARGVRAGRPASLGVTPGGMTVGAGSVWVSDAGGSQLIRVDPAYGSADPVRVAGDGPMGALAYGAGSLWVVDFGLFTHPVAQDGVARIDPASGRVQARVSVWGAGPVAFGAGALWIGRSGAVLRLDPRTNRIDGSVRLAGSVSGVVLGGGYVWARTGDTLWEIQPRGPSVVRGFPIPAGSGQIAWVDGSVWIAGATALLELDPATGATRRHPVDGGPVSLAAGGGSTLFAGVGRLPVAAAASAPVIDLGGTPTLDPAFAFDSDSARVAHATCATLVTYADGSGKLVPDAASSLPAVADGGRVYRFRIRPGMRFAPPSGAPVDAAAFASSLQRALSPALGPNATLAQAPFLDDVVGARAYQAGHAPRVSGIRAVGDVLSIRLRRAAGDLPARLAMPAFCAVPPGTPATRGGIATPVPMAGPYYVARATASEVLLRRNPGYRGPRAGRSSVIVLETNVEPDAGAAAVLRGRADFAENAGIRSLSPLYAPGGPLADPRAAARRGVRLFAGRTLGIQFLDLNTRRGLFHDPRLRTAVNLAVDRRALARAIGAEPTGAYLPPGVPGASEGGFPLRPDLPRARALAGGGGRAVVLTRELSSCPQCGAALALLRGQLARIGVTLVVKQTTEPALDVLRHPRMRWDIALDNWLFDYPDASDIAPLLERKVAGSQDSSGLDDPVVDRGFARAARLAGAARAAAYRRVADRLARHDVPWVVYATIDEPYIAGARLGCIAASPELGLDLARLCFHEAG